MFSRKTLNYLLLIASIVTMTIVTMSPFEFIIPQQISAQDIINKFHVLTNLKDYIRNIILFLPLGIAWAGIFTYKKYNHWQIVVTSLLLSAILSITIELFQVLLPSRTSSYSDIICNSLGGFLGSTLYCWGQEFNRLIHLITYRQYQHINLKFLFSIIVSYSLAIIFSFILLLHNVNLNNWNDDAYLAIAGEVNAQTSWRGYVSSVYICDRAINQSELANAFQDTHSFFKQTTDLITGLIFSDYQRSYTDLKQQIPNLYWHKKTIPIDNNSLPAITNQKKVLFRNKNSLISGSPATIINQKIKSSQEFSLNIILATDKLDQAGPARIVSLADNRFSHNLMLGQESSDLVFRLRTRTTGLNASQPSFYFPNFFQDYKLHQILITFGQNKITFYLDNPLNEYDFVFKPSTHLNSFIPWISKEWKVNLKNYNMIQAQIIFYSLILFPWVILNYIFLMSLIQKKLTN